MLGMSRFLVLCTAFTVSTLGLAQNLRPGLSNLAIVGAKVTVEPGRSLENATVIVQDGIITAVGESLTLPPGTDVIDGKGLFVYAGFIDFGVTKGMRAPVAAPRSDEAFDPTADFQTSMPTSPPDVRPALSALDLFDPDDALWKAERSAGFTTALIYPASGIIKGQGALVNIDGRGRRSCTVADRAVWAVGLDGSGNGYPATVLGAFATFRQAVLDCQWQASTRQSYDRGGGPRPPNDPALQALRSLMGDKVPALIEADQAWKIDRSLELARELSLNPVVFGAKEGFRWASRLKGISVVVKLDFSKDPSPGSEKPEKSAEDRPKEPEAKVKERQRKWLEQVGNANALANAGARVAFTTAGCRDQATFFENLRRAVKEGLSPDVALAGLTVNPAAMVGQGERIGRIEKGMAANLTVMTAGFLDSTAKTKYLIIDGIKLDPEKQPFKFDNGPRGEDREGGR